MAEIPRVAPVMPSAGNTSPAYGDARGIASGIEQAGNTAIRALQHMQKVDEKARELDRATKAEEILGKIEQDAADLDIKLKQSPDENTHLQRFQEGLADIKARYTEDIADPQVKGQVMRAYRAYETRQLVGARSDAFKLKLDRLRAETDDALERAKDIISNPLLSIEAAQHTMTQTRGLLQRRTEMGLFTRQEHQKKDEAFQDVAWSKRLDAEIRTLTVSTKEQQTGEVDWPDRLREANERVNRYAGLVSEDTLAKARERAIKQVEADERLTSAQEQRVQRQAEKQTKEAAHVFVGKALRSFDPLTPADQRMTPEQIDEGLTQFGAVLSFDTAKSLRDLRARPFLEGGTTDPRVFHDFRIRILAGDSRLSAATIHAQVPTKLSAKSAEELIALNNQNTDAADISRDPYYKAGRFHIVTILGRGTGTPEFFNLPILRPDEALKFSGVMYDFNQRARALAKKPGADLSTLEKLGRDLAATALGRSGSPAQAPASPVAPAPAGAPSPASPSSPPTKPVPKPAYMNTLPTPVTPRR